MKKDLLRQAKLYAFLQPKDMVRYAQNLDQVTQAAIQGGVDILQLRDKIASSRELGGMAKHIAQQIRNQSKTTLFIVNDRVDAAKASDADGVHLGQDDMSLDQARFMLGPDKIIGRSTHSVEQALEAQAQGADYIGFGPIFATPTKPTYAAIGLDAITQLKGKLHIPYFVIGSIDQDNLDRVLAKGAERVAVVRALYREGDVRQAAQQLKTKLRHKEEYSLR